MNKDVIYIDVEDDITAIISKVKASKEKIVALVPPKRVGVLQSAVNLRLLARSATHSDKRLVIITNNHALASLAASASLPVAKNLQSKPELAPISALEVDDGDDIINGNDLPIGEHAKQAKNDDDESTIASAIADSELADSPKSDQPSKRTKARGGAKVPNFNTFRKKMVAGIVAGVLLIAFLVWALIFAPRATVVVFAKTNDQSVNAKVTVNDKAITDLSKETIKAIKVKKTEKKTIDFAASGSKNLGEKAKGTVTFSTDSISALGTTIPAGTSLSTSGGLVFTTDTPVTMTISNSDGAQASVTAVEQGAKYNAANGSLTGAPSGITAEMSDPTSGGTDRVVKVVTAQDIQKAKEVLTEDESTSEIESQLKSSLKNAKEIQGSFKVNYTELKSTPAVGAESQSGNAVLSTTVEYVLYGVNKTDISKYLDSYLKQELGKKSDQRIYDNGAQKVEFQDIANAKDGIKLTLIATAKRGPKLDEDEIRKRVLGLKTGEIQEELQSIQGIENVEVNYFPFWVGSVPSDEDKVTVQFKVNDTN